MYTKEGTILSIAIVQNVLNIELLIKYMCLLTVFHSVQKIPNGLYTKVMLSNKVSEYIFLSVPRVINVYIWVLAEIVVFVSIISTLWAWAFWWHRQSQFGKFGLLLLQTLFPPLNASILEPNFDLIKSRYINSKLQV